MSSHEKIQFIDVAVRSRLLEHSFVFLKFFIILMENAFNVNSVDWPRVVSETFCIVLITLDGIESRTVAIEFLKRFDRKRTDRKRVVVGKEEFI